MVAGGKNEPGLKGFPTPSAADEINSYLLFLFPDSKYAQWIMGAVKALEVGYNWYESGDLSVDEAAEIFRIINQEAPTNKYPAPTAPGGTKIIRIGEDGHFQEANDDGEWQEPTGDYAIPPVPARSGGTPDDQRCLAAANCANVLAQLYEGLSDDWDNGVSNAQAATNFALAIAAAIAAPFGLAAEAIVAIAGLIFNILYETLQFIGADLWTNDFTQAVQCLLFGCATNDSGVVTFNLDCFNTALAAQTNIFDLSLSQIRLFGQIEFMLQFVGADGLNAAGATTVITSADCTLCDQWCITVDFLDNDGGFVLYGTGQGAWSLGNGWQASDVNLGGLDRTLLQIKLDLGADFDLIEVGLLYDWTGGSQTATVQAKFLFTNNFAYSYGTYMITSDVTDGELIWDYAQTRNEIDVLLQCSVDGFGGSAKAKSMTLRGTGTKPTLTGWTDCP